MFKIFYNLPNDVVDRALGNIGILDILKTMNCSIYTELNQLRGEKIDMVYMLYDEQLLSQICDLQIRKFSIYSKGDDDIVIPKNFIKYSSDVSLSMSKKSSTQTTSIKYYNIILNHRNYKTDTEILITGRDDPYQDVARNINALYGNVIMSTLSYYNNDDIMAYIVSRNLPNTNDIYYDTYMMCEGLKKCTIKKNVIKLHANEHFSNLHSIIANINDTQLTITNIGVQKVSVLKFSISGYVIAGKYDQISTMFFNTLAILQNKVTELRKKIRLEFTPEQILVLGYLQNNISYIEAREEKYVKDVMTEFFNIVPIENLGSYRILHNQHYLTNLKPIDGNIIGQLCTLKTMDDI